jgi:hypothetical protein
MDWPPTNFDAGSVAAWCTLTSDIGRPVLGLVGLGGVIAVIKSLWTLPVVASEIVTIRNKQKRYRRRTILIGWLALISLFISVGMYLYSTSLLRTVGKVCEMNSTSAAAANAVLPFIGTTILTLIFVAWFHARALRVKNHWS